MKKNYSTIKYVIRYKNDDDGIKLPIKKNFSFKNDSVRLYYNSLHLISKLNRCEHLLLMYLSEIMDDVNVIHSNIHVRKCFNTHLVRCGVKRYNDDTVKQAFSGLSRKRLLIRFSSKGNYVVNPICVFRGTETKRKVVIKSLIDNRSLYGSNINDILML